MDADMQYFDQGYSACEAGVGITDNPHLPGSNSYDRWLQGWRDAAIYDAVQNCPRCGSREFPRRPGCDSCTAAIDEDITAALLAVHSEADRIAAITREIACS